MGMMFPDVGETFPDMRETFPDVGEMFPDMREAFPDMGKTFPDMGKTFPDFGEAFPGMGKPLRSRGTREGWKRRAASRSAAQGWSGSETGTKGFAFCVTARRRGRRTPAFTPRRFFGTLKAIFARARSFL